MKRIILAIALLLVLPTQVMSGKGYVGMAQATRTMASMEEARLILTVYRGLIGNGMNELEAQAVMNDDDAMMWELPGDTHIILIGETSGPTVLLTMIWATASPKIEEACQELMANIGG